MRERVRRSVEIWWHKYGSVPTPNLVSEELVNSIALLFETPEGWPEPEWPQAAYDRIMVLEAEKQTLTKLNVGQAEELAEVRAIVAERLQKAAKEIYPGDDFIYRVPPLKGQGKSYWESRKEAAGIILAMSVDATAELERRDARVRLESKL